MNKVLSQRQIAKAVGAGLGTINRDLEERKSVQDGTENVPNGTPGRRWPLSKTIFQILRLKRQNNRPILAIGILKVENRRKNAEAR
jgi:hypothetical protein